MLDGKRATVEIDRSRMFRFVTPLAGAAARSNVRVTHSIFENAAVSFNNNDSQIETSTSFSECGTNGTNHPHIVDFENNILISDGDDALYVPASGFNPCRSVRGQSIRSSSTSPHATIG
jgi:hypothetical protein